jgi:hypothetical protein
MKVFPTLFKKTAKDTVVQWTIEVCDPKGHNGDPSILIQQGQVGKKLESIQTYIRDGKNIGKYNETTPYQQAILEAELKFEKQIKNGYVTSIEAMILEETNESI